MSFCPSCGSKNADEARFCEKCGVPVQAAAQPAAQPQDGQQDAPQAAQVLSSAGVAAGKAVRGLNPILLVAAGVAVVVLLVGYLAFFRPMSEADYEDAADDYAADLMEAQGDVLSAIDYYSYTDYPDDELSDSDLEDLWETYKEGADGIKKAASGISGLRPPKEYKSADTRMNDWAAYMSGDYLDAVNELLSKQETGRSYGRFSDDIFDFYEELSKDETRAWRAFSRAAEDLDLNYGE